MEISLRLPNSSITKNTFTNVLYSCALGNTRLFSWTTVRNRFQMNVRGNDIFLLLRGDESRTILWAKFRHRNFKIQTSENESALFTTYDEFHEAFGHSHMTKALARRLYHDGDIVPDRPTSFQCKLCKLAKSVKKCPHLLPNQQSTRPLEFIRSDLLGKFSI